MRVTLPLAFAVAALAAFPAVAAEPIARIAGTVALRTGPGSSYNVVGSIKDGTNVVLDFCTEDSAWCHVADYGWVDASFVVGWSAKTYVTPPNAGANPTVKIGMY